jgi:chitin disaccharide deacetylase
MPRIRVIVNADDLGMNRQVNDAIFDLMDRGRISSATILANAPEVADAAARIRHFPHCSFGAHLNLTEFEPLVAGEAARHLVDDTGRLSRALEHAVPTPTRLRAAYDEFCAQLDRLAALGVPVGHFDSHNHVHTRPWVFPAFKAAQRRYRIRKARLSKNIYSRKQNCPPARAASKAIYNAALRSIYFTRSTDGFTELLTFREVTQERTVALGSVELMVHPGSRTAQDETDLLESEWLEISPLDLQLINYDEL